MYPILFELHWASRSLVFRAYDVSLVLALLAVWMLGGVLAVRRGEPNGRVVLLLLVVTLASLVGARLGHWLLNPSFYRDAPDHLHQLSTGAFSIWGVVVIGSLCGWLACRLLALDAWLIADALAPGLAVGYILAKTGCFLNGCCSGQPTDLPWGVTFPTDIAANWGQAVLSVVGFLNKPALVHPSQLYEVLVGLVALLIIVGAQRFGAKRGVPALIAAICFVVGRGAVGFTRQASLTTIFPVWQAVLFYVIVLLMLITLLVRRSRSRHPATGTTNGQVVSALRDAPTS